MAVSDIDFGNAHTEPINNGGAKEVETGGNPASNQEEITNMSGDPTEDITGKDNTKVENTNTQETDETDNNPSTGELSVGDQLDVDGNIYTVAENGDIVDSEGNIFKEAKDVKNWLKSVSVTNDSDTEFFDFNTVQDELGISITDENGKPVEFTKDADGVKSFIESAIILKSKELQEAAINRLYSDNPILKQFTDYVQLTGTPRGFGEIPDRSGIILDKDNEAQLVAVIKMAAQEFGNKSLNDNYIKYLHDAGGLYDEAKVQLAALVDKDKQYRKDIEEKAEAQRKAEAQEVADYFNNVNKIISSRIIGGYRIPESFTKQIDGKKIVVTPKDFYDYVSSPNQTLEDGRKVTGYQRDLNRLSDDDYLNREMLDAWLMFTGGTYKDLIDMAIKEDKVRQLRVRSKEARSTKSVKVIKNTATKSNINDIIL